MGAINKGASTFRGKTGAINVHIAAAKKARKGMMGKAKGRMRRAKKGC